MRSPIRQSPMWALCFLGLSVAGHLAGFMQWPETQAATVAGGQEAGVVRLGNSFRDIAKGSVAVTAPTTLAAPPLRSDVLEQAHVTPMKTAKVPPDLTQSVELSTSNQPTELTSLQPLRPTPIEQSIERTTPTPLRSSTPEKTAPAQPKQVLKALAEPAIEPAQPAPKPPVLKPEPQPVSTQGADIAEQRGAAEGQRTKEPSRAVSSVAAEGTAGNADTSNYRGIVWRKIQRNKPRVSVAGTARIALQVNARGRLADVRVLRSSGHAQFDQLILRAVRKAAPFPKPPGGGSLVFTFDVKG